MKTLSTIVTCVAVWAVFLHGGRWLGTQAAKTKVAADSKASGSPAGVLGTTWLMSPSQLKQIAPTAVVSGEDELLEIRTVYGRNAKVHYKFQDNLLIGVLVAFVGESSRTEYDELQRILIEEFGQFSQPNTDSDFRIVSSHGSGRFAVDHNLFSLFGITMEQVFFYLTKEPIP